MAGISSKALKPYYAENKYKYNDGSELQSKEFSDGTGIEDYDFDARTYDPQIGRFLQIDPLGELSEDWSSYVYALDNPVQFNDPMGLVPDSASSASSLVVPGQPRPAPVTVTPVSNTPAPDPGGSVGPAPSSTPAPIPSPPPDNTSPWMDRILTSVEITQGTSEKFSPTFDIANEALHYAGGLSDPRKYAWCAAFGSWMLNSSGFNAPRTPASRNWLNSDKLVPTGPYYGAIAVFQDYFDPGLKHRTGTGHIGFLYGFMPGIKYIILGGNQGNTIKFSAYPTTAYQKEIGAYMHLEGFYFPSNYSGPRIIAPLYLNAIQLNKFYNIISGSKTTR
jgi:RHS repeat-associated protein